MIQRGRRRKCQEGGKAVLMMVQNWSGMENEMKIGEDGSRRFL